MMQLTDATTTGRVAIIGLRLRYGLDVNAASYEIDRRYVCRCHHLVYTCPRHRIYRLFLTFVNLAVDTRKDRTHG